MTQETQKKSSSKNCGCATTSCRCGNAVCACTPVCLCGDCQCAKK